MSLFRWAHENSLLHAMLRSYSKLLILDFVRWTRQLGLMKVTLLARNYEVIRFICGLVHWHKILLPSRVVNLFFIFNDIQRMTMTTGNWNLILLLIYSKHINLTRKSNIPKEWDMKILDQIDTEETASILLGFVR